MDEQNRSELEEDRHLDDAGSAPRVGVHAAEPTPPSRSPNCLSI